MAVAAFLINITAGLEVPLIGAFVLSTLLPKSNAFSLVTTRSPERIALLLSTSFFPGTGLGTEILFRNVKRIRKCIDIKDMCKYTEIWGEGGGMKTTNFDIYSTE